MDFSICDHKSVSQSTVTCTDIYLFVQPNTSRLDVYFYNFSSCFVVYTVATAFAGLMQSRFLWFLKTCILTQ